MESENTLPRHFAFIVDGEVAYIQSLYPTFNPNYEHAAAVFSSSPLVVEIDPSVDLGYIYDSVSGEFSAPQEG